MSALLDEPSVRQAVHPISVEFYQRLGELGLLDRNTELLDGVIVKKMSRSPLHSAVARRLHRLIAAALGPNRFLMREDPIITADSAPEPDLAVIEGREDDYIQQHPRSAVLAVEIAVFPAELDRRKAAIYAAANIPEYWLVEPEAARITAFRQPENGRYLSIEIIESGHPLASAALPGLTVNPAELFRRPFPSTQPP